MATTKLLFSEVQSFFTPEFIGKASTLIGDSHSNVSSTLKNAVPTFLMGIADRGSTREGASSLIQKIQDDGYDAGVPSQFVNQLSQGESSERYMSKGKDLVSSIFGSQAGSLSTKLAETSGTSNTTTSRILSLIAPMAMGILGSKVKTQGWNSDSLAGYLNEQRKELKPFLPSGLSSAFNDQIRNISPIRQMAAGNVDSSNQKKYSRMNRRSSTLPLAIVVLIALAAFFLLRGKRISDVQPPGPVKEQAGQVDQPIDRAPPMPPRSSDNSNAVN